MQGGIHSFCEAQRPTLWVFLRYQHPDSRSDSVSPCEEQSQRISCSPALSWTGDVQVLPAAMEPQQCSWRAPAKCVSPARTTEPYSAGGHGAELTDTVMAFGSKSSSSDSNTDMLCLQSVWVCANLGCTCKLHRVVLCFLTSLNLQHHVIILGKGVKKEGLSFMHISSKRTDNSCKQVVPQNCQIYGKGWS